MIDITDNLLGQIKWAYIKKEMDLFVEPSRAGTPKGKKIGFSRQKYLASILIALLDTSLRDIAEMFIDPPAPSYALMRKWKTEPEFKKAMAHHAGEVSQLFFDIANNMMLVLELEL